MKKLFVWLGFVFFTISCSEKNTETSIETDRASRTGLEEVAKGLVQDPSWVTAENLAMLKNGSVRLSEITANRSLSKVSANGKPVEIELYHNSKIDGLAKKFDEGSYYVSLDPDVFHFGQETEEEIDGLPVLEIPAYYMNEGTLTETTVTLDPNNSTENLIFFVNYAYDNNVALGKTNIVPGVYFGFRAVNLKYKSDESYEEFEVYFSDGSDPINSYFNGTTNHIFNGMTRPDAGGASRYYPDVNSKLTYTTLKDQEIALVRVDNLTDSVRMVAIEADWSSGDYIEDNIAGKYNRDQQAGTISTLATDYYDMTDNTKKLQENSAYYVQEQRSLNDDRYEKGAIKSINLRTLNARTDNGAIFIQTVNANGGALQHMDWTIKMITYQ